MWSSGNDLMQYSIQHLEFLYNCLSLAVGVVTARPSIQQVYVSVQMVRWSPTYKVGILHV